MRAMRLGLGIVAITLLLPSCDEKKDATPTPAPVTATAAPATAAPTPAPSAAPDGRPSADAGSAAPAKPAAAPAPTPTSQDPTTAPAATPSVAPPALPPTEPPAQFDASEEKFGELKFGLSVERVQELFPGMKAKGTRRANLVDDGALAGYDQQWVDKAAGVTVTMTSETKKGPQIVSGFVIESPSTLKSASGVGVGDRVEVVKKAYPETSDSDPGPGELFALDGWLTLTMKDGKVASMSFAEPYMGG